MRYFTYLAEQAFKTSPEGERLFYQGGPWSRPYVIPDEATEQRLYKKQVWSFRILFGGLIFGQPILFSYLSDLLKHPLVFPGYFLGIMAVVYLATKITFASDLRSLKRLEKPLGLTSFYAQMAQQHSKGKLLLGLLASLIFVACGALMLVDGENILIALFGTGLFSLVAMSWGYALYLKFKS
jgi:hypothetical protein